MKQAVESAEVLVRVNPIHEASDSYSSSQQEIDDVIRAGADIVMLPFITDVSQVRDFLRYVGGRAKTMPLIETPQSVEAIDEILALDGIDEIYIGLNDAVTKKQMFETEKYLDVLKTVCRSYHVPFSVNKEQGGYFHEDGTYTEENSFVLLLIGTEREVVKNIAKDLCTFFGQESVMVTENQIGGYFINRESKE